MNELASDVTPSADEVLAAVTARINEGRSLEEICDFVYDSFRPLIPFDRIGVALLVNGGEYLRARWARTEYPYKEVYKGYTAPMAGSSLQRVLETCEPRVINDLSAYLREHPDSISSQRMVLEGIRSSMTFPLCAGGRAIGFLFFSSRWTDTFQDEHRVLFGRIACQVALAVERALLTQDLEDLREDHQLLMDRARRELRDPLVDACERLERVLVGGLEPAVRAQLEVALGDARSALDALTLLLPAEED